MAYFDMDGVVSDLSQKIEELLKANVKLIILRFINFLWDNGYDIKGPTEHEWVLLEDQVEELLEKFLNELNNPVQSDSSDSPIEADSEWRDSPESFGLV